MENFIERFKKYILQEGLFSPADKPLIAVSGGVDSVVLCDLCYKLDIDFVIAHCNFQLRGEESSRDEAFVKKLAGNYHKEILIKKFETEKEAKQKSISIQEAARELRYEWFNEFADHGSQITGGTVNRKLPAVNYILTAHHADDNIETLLMNFFRGTGITGLRGILPKHGKLVRPLLFATKEEILAYAKENNLSWVEDSSNESSKYTRNYFRNEIIPLIENKFPAVKNNLLGNLHRFREIEDIYHHSIKEHKKKLMEQRGAEFHIPVLKLKKTVPLDTIIYEIIRDFGFTAHQTGAVTALLDADTGRYITSSTHRILKNRNRIIIAPLHSNEPKQLLIEELTSAIETGNGEWKMENIAAAGFQPPDSNHIACFDSAEISFPLIARKWETGDYFYPLGMKKKKKLSRFFIDQKLSKTEKEKIWVLEMNKKIIWVVGHRIDDRFKITGKTKTVLMMRSGLIS